MEFSATKSETAISYKVGSLYEIAVSPQEMDRKFSDLKEKLFQEKGCRVVDGRKFCLIGLNLFSSVSVTDFLDCITDAIENLLVRNGPNAAR